MTPNRHYEIAEDLAKKAYDQYETVRNRVESGRLGFNETEVALRVTSVLAALAQVHATLATVSDE